MQIGPYTVVEELGRGGMGVVYRVRRGDLQRDFALKVIRGDGDDPEAVQRFRREAQAAAALSGHPGIVGVTDIGEDAGQVYFAMDCVEGRSLDQLIDRGDLSPHDIATLIEQAARAVQHAHSHGVLHRDIKPGNIMVTERGEARVTDFGLAKFQNADQESARLTQSGIVIGTPSYMPPEQARSEGLDARADVYSLGATLYEALVGTPPFDGASIFEVLGKLMREEPRSPRTRDPRVPAALDVIVMRCLEKEREQRYLSAGALADDLGRWLRGEQIVARKPSLARRAKRWLGRHKTLATAGVLLVAGGAATLGVWLNSREQSERDRETIDQLSTDAEEARRLELARAKAVAVASQAQAKLGNLELLLRVPEPDPNAVRAAAEEALQLAEQAMVHDATLPLALLARSQARAHLGDLEGAHGDAAAAVEHGGGDEAQQLQARIGLRRYLRARGVPVPILAQGVLTQVFQLPESPRSAALRPTIPESQSARPPELAPALALADGRSREALAGFDAAVAAEPYNAWTCLYRGHARVLLLDIEEARADYARALRLVPGLADAHYGLATCALFRGDAQAALDACRAAPEGPERSRLQSQAQLVAGDTDDALRTITAAMERWPDAVGLGLWRYLVVAAGVPTAQQQRMATDDLGRIIDAEPDHWYARSLRGKVFKMRGQYAKALEDFEIAVRARPDDGYLQAQLANALLPLGRHEEALRAHLRWHTSEQLWVEGRREELQKALLPAAVQAMTDALELKPGDPELTMLRAMAMDHLPGKTAEQSLAAQRELEAVANDPVYGPAAKMFLGQGLLRARQFDVALRLLSEAAAEHPGVHAQTAARLGMLQRAANRPQDELVSGERVLELDPLSGPHNYNLAVSYIRMGGVRHAVPLLMRTTYFYAQSMAHGLLGQMRLSGLLGDAEWEQVQAGCARTGALRSSLANNLLVFGRYDEALALLQDHSHDAIGEWPMIEAWALVSSGRAKQLLARQAALLAACEGRSDVAHHVYKALSRAYFVTGNLEGAARCMSTAGPARHSAGPGHAFECPAPQYAKFLTRMAARPRERWNHNDYGTAAMMCVRSAAPEQALEYATRARELRAAGGQVQSGMGDLVAIQAGSLVRRGRAGEAVALIEAWGYRPGISGLVDPVAVTAYLRAGHYERAAVLGAQLLKDSGQRGHILGATVLALAKEGRRYEAAKQGALWLRVVSQLSPNWQLGGHLDPREVRDVVWGAPPTDHDSWAAHAVLAMEQGDRSRVLDLVDRAVASIDRGPADGRGERHGALLVLRARAVAAQAIAAPQARWRAGPALPKAAAARVPEVRALLEEAWRLGWRSTDALDQDYEFVVLRRLPEFQRFAAELAARPR